MEVSIDISDTPEFIVANEPTSTLITRHDMINITVEGGEDVRLFVEDGQLKATGDMDKGARIFFDEVIKLYLSME